VKKNRGDGGNERRSSGLPLFLHLLKWLAGKSGSCPYSREFAERKWRQKLNAECRPWKGLDLIHQQSTARRGSIVLYLWCWQ